MLRRTALDYIVRMDINRALARAGKLTPTDGAAALAAAAEVDSQRASESDHPKEGHAHD
jgi:hypothetical protein